MAFPPVQQASNSVRKQLLLHNGHATIVSVGTSCLQRWCCGIPGPVLGKTIGAPFHPEACITAYITMKAS